MPLQAEDHGGEHGVDDDQHHQHAQAAEDGQRVEQEADLGLDDPDQDGQYGQEGKYLPHVLDHPIAGGVPPQCIAKDGEHDGDQRQPVEYAGRQPQPVARLVQVGRAGEKGHVGVQPIKGPQRDKEHEKAQHGDRGQARGAAAAQEQYHCQADERAQKGARAAGAERHLAAVQEEGAFG